jgi:hypothetical protein
VTGRADDNARLLAILLFVIQALLVIDELLFALLVADKSPNRCDCGGQTVVHSLLLPSIDLSAASSGFLSSSQLSFNRFESV